MRKILIATGGSGGHVFPSVALATELKNEGVDVLLSGCNLSGNRYLNKDQFVCADVRSGPGIKNIFKVMQGIGDSIKVLDKFKPDLVIGFGSYTSFPLLAAAKLKKIPIVLWAADSVPGKVIRWFSPFAKMTVIQFPQAATFLSGKVVEAKMPLRENYKKDAITRQQALLYYGLEGDKPVVLVFGGSYGAKVLNYLAPQSLSQVEPKVDVIHIVGNEMEVNLVQELYEKNNVNAKVISFEKNMNYAWSAATIAVTRAGAVSVAELVEFEVPTLLIPYPFATDNHQGKNADYLVSQKLARKREENVLSVDSFTREINQLLVEQDTVRKALKNYKSERQFATLNKLILDNI